MKARSLIFGLFLSVLSIPALVLQSEPDLVAEISVRFTNHNPLPPQTQELLSKEYEGRTFDNEWVSELIERVRNACQEQGYFKALVSSKVEMIGNTAGHRVIVQLTVNEGEQFRLAEIRWKNLSAFQPNELRSLVPLRDGEILNTQKILEGIEAVRKLYASKGYINFTAVPDAHIDDATRTASLDLDLEEGAIFRVRSVRVLGGDNATRQGFQKSMKPGDVFNPMLLEETFRRFRPRFPKGRDFYNVIETVHDNAAHAVDVIVDLRRLD